MQTLYLFKINILTFEVQKDQVDAKYLAWSEDNYPKVYFYDMKYLRAESLVSMEEAKDEIWKKCGELSKTFAKVQLVVNHLED